MGSTTSQWMSCCNRLTHCSNVGRRINELCTIEEALSESQQNRPTVLYGYVDDLFWVFWSDKEAQFFFCTLNFIYKSINFTQEQEWNRQLAFRDILGSRITKNVAQTSVFRKKTHTRVYLKWTSFVSYRYKRNLVNSLLQRSYNIWSLYQFIHNNFMTIKDIVKIIKNNLPCFSTNDWRPNFKSLFVHLCLINYWISQSCDLDRKDYLSLFNRCLS